MVHLDDAIQYSYSKVESKNINIKDDTVSHN